MRVSKAPMAWPSHWSGAAYPRNCWLKGAAMVALAMTLAAVARPVGAIARVGNLAVSASGVVDDDGLALVPEGTESVQVSFDYNGASRSMIAVRVEGLGGMRLFEESERYSGEGSAEVVVTGAAVYRQVATLTKEYSRELYSIVTSVASDSGLSSGEVIQYLTDIENLAGRIEGQAQLLEDIDLDPDGTSALLDVQTELLEIDDLLQEAKALPVENVEARRARAEDMKPVADRLRTSASTLASSTDGLSSAPLPVSGDGWQYTVSVRLTEGAVQDALADSTEFQVGGTYSGTKTGESAATRTPTSASSGNDARETGGRATATVVSAGAGGSAAAGDASATTAAASGDGRAEDGSSGGTGAPGNTAGESSESSARSSGSGNGSAEADRTAVALAGDGAGSAGEIGAESGSVAVDPGGSQGQGDGGSAVEALPTWTVPASGRVDSQQPAPRSGADTGGGDAIADAPDSDGGGFNLGILALGILALVAAALFFRSRL